MAIDIKVPSVGESVKEAVLAQQSVRWWDLLKLQKISKRRRRQNRFRQLPLRSLKSK